MPKSNPLSPARSKYLSLLKQTTGIELDVVATEDLPADCKSLRQSESGEHIFVKNQQLNIVQRAQRREQLQKSRQQNNLENIFSMAVEYVNNDTQFERLDLDWLMKFSDLAMLSYSSTMQELWSKILAVEFGQPGTFSIRTLKTLADISTKEAVIFYTAVKLMCRIDEEKSAKILTGVYKKPTLMSMFSNNNRTSLNLSRHGLSYPKLMTLADLGLMHGQEIESAPYQQGQDLKLTYHGQPHQVKIKQKDVIFTYYKLTQTGYELSKLVTVDPDKNYIASLLAEFSNLVSTN